jgi:hypothetical protein
MASWKERMQLRERGINRRDLLRVGALSVAGGLLPRELYQAAETTPAHGSARSVILVALRCCRAGR